MAGSDDILDMAIIGAGISGLGLAAWLVRANPGTRFAILERRARTGGTWDLFRYPGVRSDSDMHTLGFGFAPWRSDKVFASGEDILAYLDAVVAEHGLGPHIRFGHAVTAARWCSAAQCWTLDIAGGAPVRARWIWAGAGYYDAERPHDAEIPGIARFAGTVVHPQAWPPGLDCAGKRVAVIGSGATAVTIVPALAGTAAHVTMVQRTPSWIMALPSRDGMAAWMRRLLPERMAHRLIRWRNVRLEDLLYRRTRTQPRRIGGWLRRQAKRATGAAWNPADFTPPYDPWDQRLCVVPDGDFFRALRKGQASIATGTIRAVEPDAIVLADGRRVEADIIVTATGLRLSLMGGLPLFVDGAPVELATRWWYRDCMFSGVPNFAALFGYLNAAWTLRVDSVAPWLCGLLRQMAHWRAVSVMPTLPTGAEPEEEDQFRAYSSGYLQRAKGQTPRSAAHGFWRINMDHLSDRAELAVPAYDDPALVYRRAARVLVEHAATT